MEEREIELMYWTPYGMLYARFYWEATEICILEICPHWLDGDRVRDLVTVMAEGYEYYLYHHSAEGASRS